MLTTTIDTRGLNFVLDGVKNALLGQGGDVSTLCADESRLLAVGISDVARPKDRTKTGNRIAASYRAKFLALGQEQTDFEANTGKEGHTGVKWYRCDSKFLFGVAPDSDLRHAEPQTLVNIYYRAKMIQGKTVVDFKHPRRMQRVAITTKVLTTKGIVNRAIAIGKKAIGKLPASWFATAKKIQPSLVGPQWIERHIKGTSTSKSVTDLSGLSNVDSPSVTFGSRAVGVMKFDRAVQFAVNLREKKLAARLRLILSGYSKDVAQGIRVKRRAHQVKGQP